MTDFETYFNEKYASISFSLEKKLIEIIFKDTEITNDEYKLTLSKALVVIKQNDFTKWLIDVGTKQHIPQEEKNWVKDFLMPDLIDAGINKIAFIIKPENFNQEQKQQLEDLAKIKHAKANFFTSKDEANKWLEIRNSAENNM